MARATKKPPRNKDSSKFAKAVRASADADADELAGTGVEHTDAGPVYLEKLTPDERQSVGDDLAELLLDIAEKEQRARDAASGARDELKTLREKRDELRDQWLSGVRKRPAQGALPGVEGAE